MENRTKKSSEYRELQKQLSETESDIIEQSLQIRCDEKIIIKRKALLDTMFEAYTKLKETLDYFE